MNDDRKGIDLLVRSIDTVAGTLQKDVTKGRPRIRPWMVIAAAAGLVLGAVGIWNTRQDSPPVPGRKFPVEVKVLRVRGADVEAQVFEPAKAGIILVAPKNPAVKKEQTMMEKKWEKGTGGWVTGTSVLLAPLAVVGLAAGAAWAGEPPDVFPVDPSAISYHLRVVRVVGSSTYKGAAIGCEEFCGLPIVAPAEEAWGTPEQLAALARSLGGTRADAVTGYVVQPKPEGLARFEATFYPGAAAVSLRFAARAPATPGAAHDLSLKLLSLQGEPLAESRLLAGTNRTVAVAAPSPVEGEWVVLAVTPLGLEDAEQRLGAVEPIKMVMPNQGINPPKLIHSVQPQYPEQARKEKRQGKVVLEAVLGTDGVPQAIKVIKVFEGGEDCAAAAVEAARQWRYEPATDKNGKPVQVYFALVIHFSLS